MHISAGGVSKVDREKSLSTLLRTDWGSGTLQGKEVVKEGEGERSKVDDNWNLKENEDYFDQHIIHLNWSKHLQYALFKCLLPN